MTGEDQLSTELSSWRFDPVRGQYVPTDTRRRVGSGDISAIDQFHSKTILLLGATGFVGKVLLAMVLERFPELKHLIIQVRPKKNLSGPQRFLNEILESPPLRPTRRTPGCRSNPATDDHRGG